MDRLISQALSSLLPALVGPMPPELVELAVSLLAQSRSRASSLKSEEEIARPYACANVACERLKQTLGLPKIQPRPPCPPKVYQKLYEYLDSALPIATRKSTRATKVNDPFSTSSPAKQSTPAGAANLKSDTLRRKANRRQATDVSEVPSWVMPVIRVLCQKMLAPAAPHHIFAGVSSIILSWNTAQGKELNVSALIVAVYLFVRTRLAGVKTPSAEYQRQKTLALDILKKFAGKDAKQEELEVADVDECARKFGEHRWTEMDWFENIPIGIGLGVVEGSENVADDASGDEEFGGEQLIPVLRSTSRLSHTADHEYLQPGLGTMMQDRVDYLSDDRMRDYQEWKENILTQIDELEKIDNRALEAG